MVKAIFDQEVNPQLDGDKFKKYIPRLYYIGQRSIIFNNWTFGYWFLLGVLHSIVVFILPLYIFWENCLNANADNNDMWSFSVSSFTSVMIVRIYFSLTFK